MVILFVLLVLLVDQGTKFFLLGNVAKNTGIAFGIGGQHSLFVAILLGIGLASSLYLYSSSEHTRFNQVLWGSIAGGIVSNLIDRIRIGTVLDPITIPWLRLSLNIADVVISIGCAVIFLQLLSRQRAKR